MRLWSQSAYPGMVHALTVTLLTPCVGLAWQTPIAFEVATIKPSTANSLPIGIRRNQSQFTTSNTSIAFLIRWVYDLDERRLVGTTNNLESIRYDIVGKVPAGELAPGQLQLMMQSLLADRFKLRVHKEMRELSAYALVVDKDGPKLHFVDLEDGIGQNPFKMTDRGRLGGHESYGQTCWPECCRGKSAARSKTQQSSNRPLILSSSGLPTWHSLNPRRNPRPPLERSAHPSSLR